jgi:hypothetical protein
MNRRDDFGSGLRSTRRQVFDVIVRTDKISNLGAAFAVAGNNKRNASTLVKGKQSI